MLQITQIKSCFGKSLLADQILARPGIRAQPDSDIDGISQRGNIRNASLSSYRSNKCLSCMHADAHRNSGTIRSDPFLAEAFENNEAGELWARLEELPSGRAFLTELSDFLEEYGHREAGGTLLVSQSTWKDAPEVVLGILNGIAAAPPPPSDERSAWKAARDELLAHPFLRFRSLRSAFLKTLMKARCFPQLREDTRFYAMLPLPVLRRTLIEFGRRFADAGVLDIPEDVFHLKLEELEQISGSWPPPSQLASELRSLVAWRKSKRAELEGTPFVDRRLIRPTGDESDALLSGTPGSPGVAEGSARIIRGRSEFGRLRPGEVLVAPYTNPAWTPLFQRAVAVVVVAAGRRRTRPSWPASIASQRYWVQ